MRTGAAAEFQESHVVTAASDESSPSGHGTCVQSCLELLELELAAAMFGEKIRGGNRGGHDRFNWDDVKNDKFRFVCLSFEKS